MKTNVAFDPVAFTGELVRIPSCDPPGGELEVARHVAQCLTRLGIENHLDEFLPGRANVIGRVRGSGNKKPLVFSAHMDTVPVGDQPWDFDPFAGDLVGGRLRGRGSSDMKPAIAAFMAAADRLNCRTEPLAGDVVLAFTAGESANCLGARRLVEQGFQEEIGAFLCGEPSSLDLVVAEKAILWLQAETRGQLGHVSGNSGVNAIDLMADFIHGLRHLELDLPAHPLLSPPSVHVGRISGGSAVNLTPDRCLAEIDVRFGPGVALETVLEKIQTVCADRVELRVSDFKPAIQEDPGSAFSLVCRNAIREQTGRPPQVLGVSYYSDGAILLDGLDVPFAIVGPGDLGMSGQRNETATADAIPRAAEIYHAIAVKWLG